ncbi:MAG: BtpA/SgcQ family protein [Phycisphaerae bacterium]|jgi:hypothetical protein
MRNARALWAVAKPVIGMLHAPALPGAPLHSDGRRTILDRVLGDAEALVRGGVHGLMLENFGDAPFFPGRVPPSVIAHLTWLAVEVRRRFDVPLGVNVLRNDGCAALAVALAAGAQFIRVNVLCGARVADQGILHGIAHDLLRDRAALGARHIRIFADVAVKHSAPLGGERAVEDEVADLLHRGGADALIVSGAATGKPTDIERLRRVKAAAGRADVFVGSGVAPETVGEFLPYADGLIVGTSLKRRADARAAVDLSRVRALMRSWRLAARLDGVTSAGGASANRAPQSMASGRPTRRGRASAGENR